MHCKSIAFVLSFLTLGGVCGCGDSGPETAVVTGTVTLDDKPVPAALITFFPETSEGTAAYGATDLQGKYSLAVTNDQGGAPLGKHRVEIVTNKVSASEIADMLSEGQPPPPPFVAIPKKYRERGVLTAEVVGGSNVIDFKLTSQ